MVPIRGKLLFPAGIFRRRVRAANIAANNSRAFPNFSQRPFNVRHDKPPVLPICDDVLRAETIEIDRDVNARANEPRRERLKTFAPVFAQDRAAPLSISRRPIVRPRMHFEPAFSFGAAIRENIVRPPAFEISAAPDRNVLDVQQLERTVDPTAAAPFRRSNVPVRMIVERNENDWFADVPQPESGQIMKIARTVENERTKLRIEFAKKFLHNPRRRRKTQLRPPFPRVNRGQTECLLRPGVIEIKMQCAAQKFTSAGAIETANRLAWRREDLPPPR